MADKPITCANKPQHSMSPKTAPKSSPCFSKPFKWHLKARARMALSKAYEQTDQLQDAYATLETLALQVPSALPLLAPKLAALAQKLNAVDAALNLLETSYAKTASLDVLSAIVQLRTAKGETDTSSLFAKHLEREPSLVAATQWVANEKFEHEQFHPQVQRALERAAKPLQRYRCAACGLSLIHI